MFLPNQESSGGVTFLLDDLMRCWAAGGLHVGKGGQCSCWVGGTTTVDGSEIRRSPVDMVNICKYQISHYLQGFIHPRWLFGISSINSRILLSHETKLYVGMLLTYYCHWVRIDYGYEDGFHVGRIATHPISCARTIYCVLWLLFFLHIYI